MQTFPPYTPATRSVLFKELYKKAFPAVARYVSKKGGSLEAARDVFQDALVIYYEKAVAGQLAIQVNEQAYLLGIAKHCWLHRFRENRETVSLDDFDGTMPAEASSGEPSGEKILHYLETAGQKCLELLQAFYYHKLPAQQLAKAFGYRSERSATVQKYKCLEKLRTTVKQRSLTYEDFLE